MLSIWAILKFCRLVKNVVKIWDHVTKSYFTTRQNSGKLKIIALANNKKDHSLF